jgi:hypothetical protein
MNNKEIDNLKKQRNNLQLRIKEWKDKGKNAKNLVIEYHKLLSKLRECGIKADAKVDYLQLDYWDNIENTNKIPTPINTTQAKQQEPKLIDNKSFSLCLAWTSLDGFPVPTQINKVKGYFDELCLNVEDESTKIVSPGCTEHVLRYGFEGSEESFRLLKICTQFVLDSFAESDFDKFNIAVYGKRKNY